MTDPPQTPPPGRPTIRAFVDANVLIAAALGGGSGKIWEHHGVTIVTSEYTAIEAWENLIRHPLASDDCRNELLRLLVACEIVIDHEPDPSRVAAWALPDPHDIPIMAAAIDASCDLLVTADAECFGRFYGRAIDGVEIIKPGRFLARLGR